VFRKADGTAYSPSDEERKAMLLFKGGRDMKELFQDVGKIVNGENYEETVEKIKDGFISKQTVSFNVICYFQISPKARSPLRNGHKRLAMQPNSPLLRIMIGNKWQLMLWYYRHQIPNCVRELYSELMKLGISIEQSVKRAHMLASGHSSNDTKVSEEVRGLKIENKSWNPDYLSNNALVVALTNVNQERNVLHLVKFALHVNSLTTLQWCVASQRLKPHFGQLSSAEESDSDESCNRIVVGKLDSNKIAATVSIIGKYWSFKNIVEQEWLV